MSGKKREISNEILIKIRILKALADIKPYGIFKHFYMVRIWKNLKRPNIISMKDIWKFMMEKYDLRKLDDEANEIFLKKKLSVEDVFKEQEANTCKE